MTYLNNISHKIIAVVILFSSHFYVTFAQDISFEHLNSENGLPINSVTCFAQDNDGFVWMGSMNGLLKFDGYSYHVFQYNYADSSSLPGHLVTQIVCGKNGLLYLSVKSNGFSILDPKTEKFRTFKPDSTNGLKSLDVKAIVKDSNDNLWLGTHNGLHFFNTKTHKFTRYSIATGINSDSADNYRDYISSITIDKTGNLYILGNKGSLTYFNTKTFKPTQIKYTTDLLTTLFAFNAGHVYINNDNTLWIGTEKNGMYIYDNKTKKTIKHLFPGSIISVIIKIENRIWVGADGQGLYTLDNAGTVLSNLINNPYNSFSLSSNSIYDIFESRDHTVWVGNFATGVNIYNESRYKFKSITDIGLDGQRISNRSVLCLTQLNDKLLLIGTDGGGVNIINLASLKINQLKASLKGFDKIVVKSICRNNDNSFYFGTYGQGLFYCTINSKGLAEYKPIQRPNSSNLIHVWSLHKASDTALWVGYLNSGLSIYNPITNYFTDIPFFNEKNILLIREIDNEIWISAEQKGLFICNKRGEVIRHFENKADDPHSLSSNNILDIFTDSKNQIWIATSSGGLNKVTDKLNGIFDVYNTKNGLPSNLISNIQEDTEEQLWLSSDMGLIKFDPANNTHDLFDKKDGLQGKNFNNMSSFNHNNVNLFFGGVDGLSIFGPDKIYRNTIVPQIAFTSLSIDNRKVNIGDTINGRILFDKSFSSLKKLNLSHKENDFIIEFSALHYESSQNNQYRYKLEGFDKDWISCSAGQHSARYTNLRKGDFVFKVKAANADGVWNETPKELYITIKPPFYETLWFYGVLTVLLIILIIVIIRWRTHYLHKEREKLTLLVNQRTEALRDKANEVIQQNEEISVMNSQLQEYVKTRDKIYSIIAHDLRSPLGAIISLSNILKTGYDKEDIETIKRYINIIWQTSSKMNSLIINLLYWVNNQSNKIELTLQNVQLEKVFSEVYEITEANAFQKNINMVFSHNQSVVYADYEMLVVIIRNLVSNSIKFTPKGGFIEVLATMKNNKTIISIRDTGVGITDLQIETLEKREKLSSTAGTENELGTGLGLFLCKDLTEKNGGTFIIESECGKGTNIQLILPSQP